MFGRKKKQAPTTPPAELVQISPAEAVKQTRSGAIVLVDVREPDERKKLAPAVEFLHVPVGDIDARMGELPTDRPLAFVCRSGKRSTKAATAAAAAGLDVRNVTGGMTAWYDADLPTIKETAA